MVDEVRPRLHAHGDGVFTAYIPYRLLYEFDAAEHPDGPMNPYGGGYMCDWLQLPFEAAADRSGSVNYAYGYGDGVFEVGGVEELRRRLCVIQAALARRPAIQLLAPDFDFATAGMV